MLFMFDLNIYMYISYHKCNLFDMHTMSYYDLLSYYIFSCMYRSYISMYYMICKKHMIYIYTHTYIYIYIIHTYFVYKKLFEGDLI